MSYYEQHVFFCTNLREQDKKCCQQAGASELRDYAKSRIKALGLSDKGRVRINSAGCLGRCAEGPNIVVYPEGVWYTYSSQADIDEIIQSHIIEGKIVERLLLSLNNSEP
jgi:(2Fe-2S) ferredoxin